MKKAILTSLIIGFFAVICFSSYQVSFKALFNKQYNGHGLTLGKILDDNQIYIRYYVTYISDTYKISGIMNIPKGKGPFPVIILNHGYIDPRYYTNGRGLKREQDYLARHGYAVLHADYRNHAGSDKDPDNYLKINLGYTEDVINAVYAVKNSELKVINKNKIGMLGHSLGGGIALNIMAIKPGLVNAYVLFAPTSIDYSDNFDKWIKKHSPEEEKKLPTKYGNVETRAKLISLYGTPQTNPGFWNGLSVKNYIDRISDPVELHHGNADDSVPIEWSFKLAKEFKNKGKAIKLFEYKGQPHEFTSAWPLVMERSVKFYDSYLK